MMGEGISIPVWRVAAYQDWQLLAESDPSLSSASTR